MKNFLFKVASFIVAHLARSCVYESKKRGDCLCKHCEKTDCKVKQMEQNLEVLRNDLEASH